MVWLASGLLLCVMLDDACATFSAPAFVYKPCVGAGASGVCNASHGLHAWEFSATRLGCAVSLYMQYMLVLSATTCLFRTGRMPDGARREELETELQEGMRKLQVRMHAYMQAGFTGVQKFGLPLMPASEIIQPACRWKIDWETGPAPQ